MLEEMKVDVKYFFILGRLEENNLQGVDIL